jgi:hypothetical protein
MLIVSLASREGVGAAVLHPSLEMPQGRRSAQARRRACRARPAMVDGAVHLVARLMLAPEADGPATGGRR